MRKKKILIFIAIINSLLSYAQTFNVNGGSQSSVNDGNNSISYDKDFGVDLYTGTVNVNIPLQKIQENNLPLDLNLNYDATGVLVNNVSGIVGQNWNLNAGGSITRKIKGTCFDELIYVPGINQAGGGGKQAHQVGFFYSKNILNRNDWDTSAHLKKILYRAINEFIYPDGLLDEYYTWKLDTEPDVFYFNFLGKSGYFFMGEDGNWKVSSKDNLKVQFNLNNDLINPTEGIKHTQWGDITPTYERKSIGRLTLVDDNGYQYIFGDNDIKSIETNLGSYYDTEFVYAYAMKWNLKKVIDPNGTILFNFTYNTGQYFLINLYNESPYVTSSSLEQQYSNAGYSENPTTEAGFYHIYRENGYFYKPSYLNKITTLNGTSIDFGYTEKSNIQYTRSGNNLLYYSPPYTHDPLYNRKWLNEIIANLYTDEIPVSNAYKHNRYVLSNVKVNFNNKLINNFDLQYANSDPRVFLYQIIKNNDEKYQFFYNQPFNLPGYLSEKTDMWGYYNGQPTSVSYATRLAFWQEFENNKYSNRGTVTSRAISGSLQQIIWPTGGITSFVFEPHSFRSRITNNISMTNSVLTEMFPNGGGGLRIKKIISEGKEREFFYNNSFDEMDNNISSGILMYEPLFFLRHNVHEMNVISSGGTYSNVDTNPIPGATSSANGILPKSDFFNSNVAYSTVFEKVNDGYIRYKFNDYNDYPDHYISGFRPYNKVSKKTDHSFERGQIKNKTYFDSNQRAILDKLYIYKIQSDLKSKAVNYNYFTSDWESHVGADPFGYGLFPIPQPGCESCNSNINPYLIYYSDKVLDSEITTEYFKDGRKIESLKRYYYQSPVDPSYTLIDKIEEYPNKLDLSKFKSVKFQYPSDMNTSSQPFSDMITKNMTGIPLSVTKYNEAQQPISRTETIFAKNSTTNNFILPISSRTIKTGLNDYGNETSVDTKITYDLYDGQGRVLQYTDTSGIPTTIIYGYNKSQPIAKIVGATYNYVNTNTNIGYLHDASDVDVDTTSENILISLLDDLRKNTAFKDYQIITYTYDPLIGVTSLTNPDGQREYYKYNPQNNKLEKVIDVNSKVIEEYKYHYKN